MELDALRIRAEEVLAQLETKRELLEAQRSALDEALDCTGKDLIAARAVVSAYRMALGEPVIPRSLPAGLGPA